MFCRSPPVPRFGRDGGDHLCWQNCGSQRCLFLVGLVQQIGGDDVVGNEKRGRW